MVAEKLSIKHYDLHVFKLWSGNLYVVGTDDQFNNLALNYIKSNLSLVDAEILQNFISINFWPESFPIKAIEDLCNEECDNLLFKLLGNQFEEVVKYLIHFNGRGVYLPENIDNVELDTKNIPELNSEYGKRCYRIKCY